MVHSASVKVQSVYQHIHRLSEPVRYHGADIDEVIVSYSHMSNETCVFVAKHGKLAGSGAELPGSCKGHSMNEAFDSFLAYFNEYALEKGE